MTKLIVCFCIMMFYSSMQGAKGRSITFTSSSSQSTAPGNVVPETEEVLSSVKLPVLERTAEYPQLEQVQALNDKCNGLDLDSADLEYCNSLLKLQTRSTQCPYPSHDCSHFCIRNPGGIFKPKKCEKIEGGKCTTQCNLCRLTVCF